MSYKAGFVGLVGLPNAGKSSFLNAILGEHLCIVSAKPQATRKRVHGVVSLDNRQMILVDSPGFLSKGQNAMTDFIAEEARQIIADVDALLLMIPADLTRSAEMEKLVRLCRESQKPLMFCMTKSDMKKTKATEKLLFKLSGDGYDGFPFSIKKTKVEDMKTALSRVAELLPNNEGPLYDVELYTTERLRDIAGELIREQCFELLSQEIPYGVGVSVNSFKETDALVRIEATILVEKESHKSIVIGKAGSQLKNIGSRARAEIEKIVQQKVFLGLHVSHRQNWTDQKRLMAELGYRSE